ncbi:hypothetical protein ACHWQZ_G007662 [Mnemiopsis leidyi]
MNERFILLVGLLTVNLFDVSRCRSFTVDWDNDRFLKDGKPFSYYSGGMHYFRVPRQYWSERMNKIRLAGMNTLQTYVSWNSHEAVEGQFNFEGDNNLTEYLSLAQSHGLNVVFRPGPYICAEWTFGGLPYWLLNKPDIQVRVYNKAYIEAIAKWFAVLLPMIKPFLYENGGPIITVQVENEYGAYGPWVCDKKYLQFLLDQYKQYLGENVVYFTMDNTNDKRLDCGAIPGLLKALDFGPEKIPKYQLQMLRRFQAHGPFINGEYWAGWFDMWGGGHARRNVSLVAERLDQMLQLNASVNFYMFHGGTNFGYTNGAMSKHPGKYNVRVTSYDYDAPLSEAGDTTPKYFAVREVMSKYVDLPPDPVPPNSPKWKSSVDIHMKTKISLFDNLEQFAKCYKRKLPSLMEHFNQSDGFILYQLQRTGPLHNVSLYGVHDRASVFVDRQKIGSINRMDFLNGSLILPAELSDSLNVRPDQGYTISILVENLGRVNHGSYMAQDYKGITFMVLFDGENVNSENWSVCPIPMNTVQPALENTANLIQPPVGSPFTPTVFCGSFRKLNGDDTFLDPRGWDKGVAFLNEVNLGRYWPTEGPQVTLYTPGVYFKKGDNVICLFEIENSHQNNTVAFTDVPILGKASLVTSYAGDLVEF